MKNCFDINDFRLPIELTAAIEIDMLPGNWRYLADQDNPGRIPSATTVG
ncbi:hypothetical protein N836_05460 [Leptolyngbya sp. Heron Island J]|nr:hypothetical protein [Leptolyngbya sp. Heron Island J]ESA37010.1 hypothetical protein N836_05460 [Leptolyngbya sp. Heron Island J]